uniref:Alanine--glyoxylate aminotransferase 2, mitochondrial n=1 Tax=Macrostomum lignano TaxID=282301 RepID=A0A1I8FRC3_9PLAT
MATRAIISRSRLLGIRSSSSLSGSSSSYEENLRQRRELLSPGLISYYANPLYIVRGSRQWLWDHTGRKYLDMFGGICTVSVGHCHPKVNSALAAQTVAHYQYLYEPGAAGVRQKVDGQTASGAERLLFHQQRLRGQRFGSADGPAVHPALEVVTLRNGYHGASPFLMGATALSTWRYATPTGFGFVNAAHPDPYRGEWGGAACRDSDAQPGRSCDCQQAGPAAFLAESIQGVGGIVQFPRGYLSKAFSAVRAAGGLCISDEVQTGFGRLGSHYWGFEAHGVEPDIHRERVPLAAVVTSPEVARTLAEALHFNTFGGNPLACAVGTAVLDVIDEEKLQENCQRVGQRLLSGLQRLRQSNQLIGDVRGKGLMVGVELVADRASRAPLEAPRMARLFEATREAGVLVGKGGFYGNVLRLQPPMCVTEADADATVEAIGEAIKAAN